MNNNWAEIADHQVKATKRTYRISDVEQWTNPDYIVEHTPSELLFARFQDVVLQYTEKEEENNDPN